MPRRRGIPFTRIGLLLIIAALFVSLIRFYVDLGARAMDLDAQVPEDARTLADAFLDTFLFRGYIASLVLYSGCALLLLGFLRTVTRRA